MPSTPDDDIPDISPATAGLLANAIAEKIEGRLPQSGIEFVTVLSTSFDEGLVPMATVVFGNDPPNTAQTIPCLTGTAPRIGQRVAVIWDHPAGCYVFGTPELGAVTSASMSLCCGKGDGPTVDPGQELRIPFCCADWEGGGAEVSIGADASMLMPLSGVSMIDAIVNYADSSGATAQGFSWIEAWIEVTTPGTGAVNRVGYGRCHTSNGSIPIPAQWPVTEGDLISVVVSNQHTAQIRLTNSTKCSASIPMGPVDLALCGCDPNEPEPPVPPVSYTLTTDGFGFVDAGGEIHGVAYIAPSDLYIEEFWFDAVTDEEGVSVVLEARVDGATVIEVDGGDILPGEYPRPALDDLPFFVAAGSTIQFGIDGGGPNGARGHMILSGFDADHILPWA